MEKLDPYRVLKIRRDASQATIQRAYRNRCRKVHPDTGGSAEAFREVNEAYKVLSDPARKERYDRTGEVGTSEPDNREAVVYTLLSACLNGIMNNLLNTSRKPSETDILALMKQALSQQLAQVRQNRTDPDRHKAALQDALGRFTADGVENVLDGLVRGQLNEVEQALANLGEQERVCQKAIEVLSKFQYRHEKKLDVMPHELSYLMPGSWGMP